MPTRKVKVIRSLPGRASPGETIEMDTGEAIQQIRAGKVVPAEDCSPAPLANKAIKKGMKRAGGN